MPRQLRILIVEDYPDTRESLRHLVEIWGHHADVADNGRDGLGFAQKCRYDAVILDLALPDGPDGIEVGRGIAQQAERPYLIAYSGHSSDTDRARTRETGFDLHLAKGSLKSIDLLEAKLARLSGQPA